MSVLRTVGISLVLLSLTTLLLIYLWLQKCRSYWKLHNVQTPPYSILWGHLKTPYFQGNAMADRIPLIYNYFKSKNLKYGGLYSLIEPWYIPIDLDIIKSIMQSDFQHFTDKGGNVIPGEPLSAHLINLKGKKWKTMRSKLTPAFSSGKMKMLFETVLKCSQGLDKAMEQELGVKDIDIKDMLARFTTDVIGTCAFGIDCNCFDDPNNEFVQKGKECFHRPGPTGFSGTIPQLLMAFAPSLLKLFNMKIISDHLTDFFVGLVRHTVDYREKNNVSRKDLMQLLIELKNGKRIEDEAGAVGLLDEDKRITIEEIAAQAFLFFEAGFETSSTAMSFALYELALNKEIQDAARKEIMEVLKKYDGNITYEALSELTYLEKIIYESLRKYPPGTALRRTCTKTYRVPGTELILPEGMKVIIPVHGIHHDPEHYPEPELFDPERFSEENKKTRHDFSFLGFGEGPRMCIGLRFGMMETKIGLLTLLKHYEFDVSEKTRQPLRWDPKNFIISTLGEIWLSYRKLNETF